MIVVGAGSAGLAAAARLVTDGRSVLVLEAGPDYPDVADLPTELRDGRALTGRLILSEAHNWHHVARATAEAPRIAIPRGKVTGGSSAINAQIFVRGVPEDYDGWAAAGNPGWSFDDLLPYFRRIEHDHDFDNQWHGQDGPIGVRRYASDDWLDGHAAFYAAARSVGHPDCPDHNDPRSTGIGPYPMNNVGELRISTAVAYLSRIRALPNFALRAETQARRVVIDRGRAVGVAVGTGAGAEVLRAGEIILSAGAIGSPQLLLCSGIGPAIELEQVGIRVLHDLPGVGKHLLDHPAAYPTWRVAQEHVASPPNPVVQMFLRYSSGASAPRNDMWACSVTVGADLMIVPGLHAPAGQGELRLVAADPTTPPTIDLRYFAEESDLSRLRDGVRRALELVETEALSDIVTARLTPDDHEVSSDAALDAWLRRNVVTGHHVCGTCKMGPTSDPLATVDESGHVHGVLGLRVADASIFPQIPRANTNCSAIAVGERVADLILGS